MSDTQGLLWFLVLVGAAATVVLWGYYRRGGRTAVRYLVAAYATSALWIGALLASLVLLGNWRYAAAAGAVLVGIMTFGFIRDKRRLHGLTTTADTTGSVKRPIFVLSTEGESKDQIKAAARQALQKYLSARKPSP